MCDFREFRLPLLLQLFSIRIIASSSLVGDAILPPPRLVEFSNDKMVFQTTSVKATFRDEFHYEFSSDSIHYNSTVIGDYLSFSQGNREVRLYFIPPELDWKQNQTYHWKLNQAWMSDDYYGWIFWNVNGFIDSQVRVDSYSPVFQCSHVEFSFYMNAPRGIFSRRQGKIVLENVEVSVFLSDNDLDNEQDSSLTIYNPCDEGGACRVVNGIATCRKGNSWKFGATVLSFFVAVLVVAFANRRGDASHYNLVDGSDESRGDSTNDEADSHQEQDS